MRDKKRPLTELSPDAQAARRPPPPAELVDALQDRVHRDIGRARPARVIRRKDPTSPFWRAAEEASRRADAFPAWKLGKLEDKRERGLAALALVAKRRNQAWAMLYEAERQELATSQAEANMAEFRAGFHLPE